MVVAAEQYAARIVLPASQRTHRTAWSSHKDIAAKALAKLAGPHLPASLNALERAVERAHAEHRAAVEAISVAAAVRSDEDQAAEPERMDEAGDEPSDAAEEEIERAGLE